MRVRTKYFVLALTVLLSSPALAQDKTEQWKAFLQSSCGKELKTYCKGVTSGQGRYLACLYSREDKLPAKCNEAVLASTERLALALTAVGNSVRACDADAKRLCNGVVAGDGNLLGCLAQARRSVSAACNATLDAAFMRP